MKLFYPPDQLQRVQTWAHEFEPVETSVRPAHSPGFYLWWGDGRLILYRDSDAHGVCLQMAEFERRATLRGELARACGVSARHKPRVLDVMAGLGVDGMTLSALGCGVVMLERDPALWALLDSFLQLTPTLEAADGHRMHEVVYTNAWTWLEVLQRCDGCFDVIYLDPMFSSRRKGALPGKSMQFLAELTSPDSHPLASWIELAGRHAQQRVVLKRRLRDPVVGRPDWQIKGRSVRYDVYKSVPV